MLRLIFISISLFVITASTLAQSSTPTYKRPPLKPVSTIEYGVASFYAKKFHGRPTSSGEIYDNMKMTAAHNNLPLGTWIRVTNMRNGKSVVVKVNDRLHHRNKRLVDLSYGAALKLKYVSRGLAHVKVEVLGKKP